MQMDIASPPSAAAAQGIGTHRHAAPVPPIPARIRRALTVVVVVVGLAAGVVTLCLPDSAANRIDAALGRLRDWPSMTVDGTVTSATGPVTVHATITADGVAHGTVERSGDARAEFAVGQGATLLRGNRQWWSDEPPVLVNQLTNRWITDPREDAVGLIASGRLAPAAVADALGVLRDPDGRNEADTVVNGVGGTAFTRAGARLVISDDGRPLAVDLPRSTAADALPGTAITFRPGPRIDAPAAGVSIGVATPGPGEDAAARRASPTCSRSSAPRVPRRCRHGTTSCGPRPRFPRWPSPWPRSPGAGGRAAASGSASPTGVRPPSPGCSSWRSPARP